MRMRHHRTIVQILALAQSHHHRHHVVLAQIFITNQTRTDEFSVFLGQYLTLLLNDKVQFVVYVYQ